MHAVSESDWKKYSAKIPAWRDRYLAERNALFIRLLTDSKKTETERFWDAMEAMEKEAKILEQCLGQHSRSKMWISLLAMRNAGMLKKDDLADFSEELQKQVFYDAF